MNIHPCGSAPRPTVAVVGSGPAGCYVSQFLTKSWPQAEVTVFEALPAPYGLVRYGVAADHQGTKGVARQFERLFAHSGARFVGNVAIGRDLSVEQLADAFDVVVLATGLPEDCVLDVPVDADARVLGAGALLRSLNGYPMPVLARDERGRHAPLGRHLAVVGMGNVAVDVVRLLAKRAPEFHGSDIDDAVLEQLRPRTIETIDVIGRSCPGDAKFDVAMLRELMSLTGASVSATGVDDADAGPVAQLLRSAASQRATQGDPAQGRTLVRLHFGLVPERVQRRDRHSVLRATRSSDGATVEVAADTVITAVGFTRTEATDAAADMQGAGDRVFRAGWLRRGPRGGIAENRKDARAVADEIVAAVEAGRIGVGRPGFAAVEPLLGRDWVDFEGWRHIDLAERGSRRPDRCRQKIVDIEEMLAIAAGPQRPPASAPRAS